MHAGESTENENELELNLFFLVWERKVHRVGWCVRERLTGVCVRERKAHRVCMCMVREGEKGSQGVCERGREKGSRGGVHQILPYVCKREKGSQYMCV